MSSANTGPSKAETPIRETTTVPLESLFEVIPQRTLVTLGSRFLTDPVLFAGSILVGSGLVHLLILWQTGVNWDGPLSPRKPALFGISSGLTVWSISWVCSQLRPHRATQSINWMIAGSLLLEVFLITMQYWRHVPSHFNNQTVLDTTIELTMLAVILVAVTGIVWVTWCSRWLIPMPASKALAIRAGLWLLLVSCALGVMITIAGHVNMASGRSPETWGAAGVLKYPHGAVLHAIQVLPLMAGLFAWLKVSHAVRLIGAAIVAHLLFLIHCLWQVGQGRSRFDVDLMSGLLLLFAGFFIVIPVSVIVWGFVVVAVRNRARSTHDVPIA